MPPADRNLPRHFGSTALCVALVLLCVLISHPAVESGFGDDSSYIYTAKRAAETGRIIYNGWATASLGYMVYLGALFIKLLGFSFTKVRAAVVLISLANAALLHRLLLRISPNNRNAVVATCAVALAPMAFSYSVLFYTDVPGMFAILVALYGCIGAMQSTTARQTIQWIVWATLANLALGTVRQIAWLGALVLLPTVGFALRRRPGVLLAASASCAVSMGFVLAMMRWFARQPYASLEALFLHYNISWFFRGLAIPTSLLLESLPLLVALLTVRQLRQQPAILLKSVVAASVVCLGVYLSPYNFLEFSYGAETGGGFIQQPLFALGVLWICVVGVMVAIFLALRAWPSGLLRSDPKVTFWGLLYVTLPCTLACLLLIMTRESAWTRYILPIVPVWVALLYSLYAEVTESSNFSTLTVATAGLYAVVSVVVVHDEFAQLRTVHTAEQWYLAQGLPREQLEASIGLDSWYEIANGHEFNEPRVRIPANSYHPRTVSKELSLCVSPYLSYFLDIHPVDVLTTGPNDQACYEPVPLHEEIAHMWSRPDATTSIFHLLPPLLGQ